LRAVDTVKEKWDGLASFFSGLWDKIEGVFKSGVSKIADFISPVTSLLGGFFDFKTGLIRKNILGIEPERRDVEEETTVIRPKLVSPQEKFFREESMSVQRTEVTIKDETGRAEVTRGGQGGGFQLEPTGTF
jgi:hypothetical protein